MRLVVFTTNYPPLNNPRAFRMDHFVQANIDKGELIVITSPVKEYIEKDKRVIRCGLRMKTDSRYRNPLKRYSILRFLHKLCWPDDKIIHQIFYLIHYLFRYRKKDDQILTVSNPFSCHLIGLLLKKLWQHNWKADIGDSYFGNQHYSFLSTYFEGIVLRTADQIIVNSDSLKNHFLLNYNIPVEKISVLPNGIRIDATRIKHIPSDFTRLSYIGNTYATTREAIDELHLLIDLAKKHPELKLRIQLFGNQFYKVHDLEKRYPELIQISYCKNEDELIEAYSNTDVLINFANKNNPGLPSKLEEYVSTGIPILNFYLKESDSSLYYFKDQHSEVYHCCISQPNLATLRYFIANQK